MCGRGNGGFSIGRNFPVILTGRGFILIDWLLLMPERKEGLLTKEKQDKTCGIQNIKNKLS